MTRTKAAADSALQQLVGVPLTTEFLLSLRGIGWEGDLDKMRDGEGSQKWDAE